MSDSKFVNEICNYIIYFEPETGFVTFAIIFFIVLFIVAVASPSRDKRFKTGYKDNAESPGCLIGCLFPLIALVALVVGLVYAIQYVGPTCYPGRTPHSSALLDTRSFTHPVYISPSINT